MRRAGQNTQRTFVTSICQKQICQLIRSESSLLLTPNVDKLSINALEQIADCVSCRGKLYEQDGPNLTGTRLQPFRVAHQSKLCTCLRLSPTKKQTIFGAREVGMSLRRKMYSCSCTDCQPSEFPNRIQAQT